MKTHPPARPPKRQGRYLHDHGGRCRRGAPANRAHPMRDLAAALAHLAAVDPDIAGVLAKSAAAARTPGDLRDPAANYHLPASLGGRGDVDRQRLRAAGFTNPRFLDADDAALRAAGRAGPKRLWPQRRRRSAMARWIWPGSAINPLRRPLTPCVSCPVSGAGQPISFAFRPRPRRCRPAGDIALQEALRRLRGWPERPSAAQTDIESALWRPWRGAAALVLWHYYRTEVLA